MEKGVCKKIEKINSHSTPEASELDGRKKEL
jgi:hypothetical protein